MLLDINILWVNLTLTRGETHYSIPWCLIVGSQDVSATWLLNHRSIIVTEWWTEKRKKAISDCRVLGAAGETEPTPQTQPPPPQGSDSSGVWRYWIVHFRQELRGLKSNQAVTLSRQSPKWVAALLHHQTARQDVPASWSSGASQVKWI